MSKQIHLRIFPDGTIQAEVQGVKGTACTDYISVIERLLQAETIDSEYTAEYYDTGQVETSASIQPQLTVQHKGGTD